MAIVYFKNIALLWSEPIFRCPILVLESDDWGAGPLIQAVALKDIADVLGRHRDISGRAPVVTLALVLAVPDTAFVQTTGHYSRVLLDDPRFASILSALRSGHSQGVFSLQLHGMEHFWPDALMSSNDPGVKSWLCQADPLATEQLPSHLQSRWVNAATLPSNFHADEAIRQAVVDEVATYSRILGVPPRVVVPPTFVWTGEVELAWAAQGIECVVTPGLRYTRRNASGEADQTEGPFINGQSTGDVTYVVRTDYFEPRRGRDAAHALAILDRDAAQGRPCVLENHRDNFCGEESWRVRSLAELDRLLSGALVRHRSVRFLSTLELCGLLRARDPEWIVLSFSERLPYFWQRIRRTGRMWKLLRLSGLAALGALLVRLFGTTPSPDSAAHGH